MAASHRQPFCRVCNADDGNVDVQKFGAVSRSPFECRGKTTVTAINDPVILL